MRTKRVRKFLGFHRTDGQNSGTPEVSGTPTPPVEGLTCSPRSVFVSDTMLFNDASSFLFMRHGANSQVFRVVELTLPPDTTSMDFQSNRTGTSTLRCEITLDSQSESFFLGESRHSVEYDHLIMETIDGQLRQVRTGREPIVSLSVKVHSTTQRLRDWLSDILLRI